VTSLVARILRTATVDDLIRIGQRSFPSLHSLLLGGCDGGIVRVAQNEVAELATIAGPIEALFDCLEAQDRARRVLVAQGHEDRRAYKDGHLAVAGFCERCDLGQGITDAMKQPKPDRRIPEPEHGPRRPDGERSEENYIESRPAAG